MTAINHTTLTNAIRALGHTPVTVPADLPYGITMIQARRADNGCFPDHRLGALAAQFGLRWELERIDEEREFWILQQ